MRKPVYAFLIIPLFVFCFKFNAYAGIISPELQAVLDTARPDQEVDVIVILSDQIDTKTIKDSVKSIRRSKIIKALKTKADDTQKTLKDFIKTKNPKQEISLWVINAIALTVRADVVPQLAQRPEVAEVRLDFAILLSETVTATTATPEWNINAIRAPELWDLGFTGQNILVANMDSGVDVNHLDLAGRWRGGTNSWFDPYGQHAGPHDSNSQGHGTGTMAIMVGGDATGTAIGVAPDAQWIAVKLFNDAGEATISAIHQSFQWLLDPDGDPNTDDAPDVVNNSWGFRTLINICFLEFQLDIRALQASGIAVVFSAGNEGPASATSISPANNPESFAVGAVDINQTIAPLSSRGPSACVLENDFFPEVVAPGIFIKTADLTSGGFDPDSNHIVSGTSFAAPHVAGAMALLLSAFPALTVSDMETALMDTAVDLGIAGPDDNHGSGMIDVLAAYQSLVPCTDADSDDFYVEAVCGTPQDCNDNETGIYPGAPEVKHDGIDQDCNGYDLTIDILSAVYYAATDELEVLATSALAEGANLQLVGFGDMSWNPVQLSWEITVASVGGDPGTVAISGIEGIENAPTVPCADSDGDGYFAEAVCGTVQDCNDNDITIYPGASEVKHDGIDQDCNDYDLTIDILSAVYNPTTDELEVLATSALAEAANLELVGFSAMSWNPVQLSWEITVASVGGDPGTVSVSGIEGVENAPTVPCADSDGDGYYIAAVCGTVQDCNDDDSTIYPGASEVKHDGIDQDCNGYDLTIDILSAKYFENSDRLCATATSDLAEGANLAMDGYGPMSWNLGLQNWEITVENAAGNPGTVTVSGIEGSDFLDTTTHCADPCEGDFDADSDVDGSDLSVFAADFGRTDCSGDCEGDFDADSDVDGSDLSVFAADFGRTDCPQCSCAP